MIRKLHLSYLLPILLLLAQQGAILHELGHYRGEAILAGLQDQRHGRDQTQLPEAPCEKCVVYAHLAGAVSPHVPAFISPNLVYDFWWQVEFAQRGTDVPSARTRGPPVLL